MYTRRYGVTVVIVLLAWLFAGCSTGMQPPPQAQSPSLSAEQGAAQEWLTAVTTLDGNTILKYTCLAQRENIPQLTNWVYSLPTIGRVLSSNSTPNSDISDVQFAIMSRDDTNVFLEVKGELRLAISATAEAVQLNEQWRMVYENETWRWCGSLSGTLPIPQAQEVAQAVSDAAAAVLAPTATAVSPTEAEVVWPTTPATLEEYVIGLWVDEEFALSEEPDNIRLVLAFFPNNRFVEGDGEAGRYYALDSETIELRTDEWTDQVSVWPVDESTARMSLDGSASSAMVAKRIVANTSSGDYRTDIVGLWEEMGLMYGMKTSTGVGWEFSPNGTWAYYVNGVISEESSYSVEGVYVSGIGPELEMFSLGNLIFLYHPNPQGSFTHFIQRLDR